MIQNKTMTGAARYAASVKMCQIMLLSRAIELGRTEEVLCDYFRIG